MKVLVVEDDPLSAFMMEELLETLGLEAELARSATECLERLGEDPGSFALVLMDIHMPDMTGDQAVTHLRAADMHPPRDMPVVAVTADPVWSDPVRRQRVGLTDYLAKPVDVEALSAMCARFGVPVRRPGT